MTPNLRSVRSGLAMLALGFSTSCEQSSTGADREADPRLLGTSSNEPAPSDTAAAGGVGGTPGTGGSAGHALGGSGGTAAGGSGGGGAIGGQGGAPPTPTAGSSSLSDSIVKNANRSCQQLADCAPSLVPMLYGDAATCRTDEQARFTWLASLPGSGVSASRLDACWDALVAGGCAVGLSRISPAVCLVTGSRAVGQSCLNGVQCQSGVCPSNGLDCAACIAAPAAGAACTSDDACGPNLFCTDSGTCHPLATRGMACGSTATCDSYLYCSGTCQPLPATAGAQCSSSTGYCDPRVGLACSASSNGTCLTIVPVAEGASCGVSSNTLRLCEARGQCSGSCVRARRLGESCDESKGSNCAEGTSCAGGVCVGYPSVDSCK
jgi:hypothetical protein